MPLIKNISTPNGAPVGFHKVKSAVYDIDSGVVAITINSWATEDAYNAGNGLVWQWSLTGTSSCLPLVEAFTATVAPFDGATVVSDDYVSLDALKTRKWADIKGQRDALINGGFQWTALDNTVCMFDSDPVSQSRINGAVTLSMLADAAGVTYTVNWTLADNTTRLLSSSDIKSVGSTLGAFVQALIDTGDTLRTQINSATTADQLNTIAWPTT